MSTAEFFRARLVDMIDLRHPLAVLATRMPWQTLEAALAPTFVRMQRPGVRHHPNRPRLYLWGKLR